MFGWLKRRKDRELRMLMYQNSCATEATLAGYFVDNPDMTRLLGRLCSMNEVIEHDFNRLGTLRLEQIDSLLYINGEVRKIYETTASRMLESFDDAHTPRMGWDFYLDK